MALIERGVVFLLFLTTVWGASVHHKHYEHPPELISASARTPPAGGFEESPLSCGPCVKESCPRPVHCLAGMVLDDCGCCLVCGRIEHENCDNENITVLPYRHKYGKCGDGLDCRLRNDLAPHDLPEALCVCRSADVLCGSDGKTYMNQCQLTEQAYRMRNGLKAVSRGPCKSAPWVVTGPDDVVALRGTNAALACEVMGFPIPVIEWQFIHPDGTMIELPSDDQHIAVQARGGPERFEVTGWLQILDVQAEDDGQYYCVAKNAEGEARTAARVAMTENEEEVIQSAVYIREEEQEEKEEANNDVQ